MAKHPDVRLRPIFEGNLDMLNDQRPGDHERNDWKRNREHAETFCQLVTVNEVRISVIQVSEHAAHPTKLLFLFVPR